MGIQTDNEPDDTVDADVAAAQAAFEAGFSGTAINSAVAAPAEASADAADDTDASAQADAPAADAPAPAKPAKKKAAAAAEGDPGAVDPYAGLDPRVRDALARQATQDHQLRSLQGRFAATQRELDALKRERAQAPAAPAAPAAAGAPATAARIAREKVRGEMPEVAEALDEVESALQQMRTPPPAPAAAPAASPSPSAPVNEDVEMARLAKLDPNWAQKMNSTEFKLWTTTLPADVNDEIWGADQAIVLAPHLKAYDAWQAAVASRATTPPPRGDANRDAGGRFDTSNTAARRESRVARSAAPPAAGARGAAIRTETPEEAFERGFKNAGMPS